VDGGRLSATSDGGEGGESLHIIAVLQRVASMQMDMHKHIPETVELSMRRVMSRATSAGPCAEEKPAHMLVEKRGLFSRGRGLKMAAAGVAGVAACWARSLLVGRRWRTT